MLTVMHGLLIFATKVCNYFELACEYAHARLHNLGIRGVRVGFVNWFSII